MPEPVALVPLERIERRILVLRGRKVLLDADLAEIYGVSTSRLNEQVKRNQKRFPEDFAFRLTNREKAEVVAICDNLHGLKFFPTQPLAFTEHGALMAATILNSPAAVEASVWVVRAFVRMRQVLLAHREIAKRLDALDLKVAGHDASIRGLVSALRALTQPPPDPPKTRIGFAKAP
ncbi:MAG: ORF6N domain-containing protein [Planctomycetota bacterium]